MKRKKRTTGSLLRDQVKIQQYVSTTDVTGGEVLEWQDLATVWCGVDYNVLRSSEQEQALQITAYNVITFSIRRRATLTEKMRMMYNGQICNILSIAEDPMKEYQQVKCEIRDNET